MNRSVAYDGTGRSKNENNILDKFVVTRRINHPELIFNQAAANDETRKRFFNTDAASRWALSKSNECHCCDKYQYVIVCYERTAISSNKELDEIKDKELLDQFKKEFDVNYRTYKSRTAPLICGSIVESGINENRFTRKLNAS